MKRIRILDTPTTIDNERQKLPDSLRKTLSKAHLGLVGGTSLSRFGEKLKRFQHPYYLILTNAISYSINYMSTEPVIPDSGDNSIQQRTSRILEFQITVLLSYLDVKYAHYCITGQLVS